MNHLGEEPSQLRKIAQIKQVLQRLRCTHPFYATQRVDFEGGSLEFCSDCDTVLNVRYPTSGKRRRVVDFRPGE